jgi:hypothetical protein
LVKIIQEFHGKPIKDVIIESNKSLSFFISKENASLLLCSMLKRANITNKKEVEWGGGD